LFVLENEIFFERFGIGRFTTEMEVDYTIEKTVEHVKRLREMRLKIE
jgi:cysteine sulfinate desulfinase/cysteine desulfurase-like protein